MNDKKKYHEDIKKIDSTYRVPLKSDLEEMGFELYPLGEGVDFFNNTVEDLIINEDNNDK